MPHLPHLVHQRRLQTQRHHQNGKPDSHPTELYVPTHIPRFDPEDLTADEGEPYNVDGRMKMQNERRRRRLTQITREIQTEAAEHSHPDKSDPEHMDSAVACRRPGGYAHPSDFHCRRADGR